MFALPVGVAHRAALECGAMLSRACFGAAVVAEQEGGPFNEPGAELARNPRKAVVMAPKGVQGGLTVRGSFVESGTARGTSAKEHGRFNKGYPHPAEKQSAHAHGSR